MKQMTCKELGGACDTMFRAATFDEIANHSKEHAMAMHTAGDKAHTNAMNQMRKLMQDEQAMHEWMDEKRAAFDAVPNV